MAPLSKGQTPSSLFSPPASAQSEICQWEVEEATRLGKRILPVLHLPLGGVEPPPGLGAINYVDFTQTPTLIAGIKDLATALRTDLNWLREGTRLLNLALDWERAARRENRLLSGEDIVEAKTWLAECPTSETPTELHRDFVKASEDAEVVRKDTERQRLEELASAARTTARRTMAGLVVSILLACIAAGLGYWAYDQSLLAQKKSQDAEVAQKIAESEAANALREKERANKQKALAEKNEAVAKTAQRRAEESEAQTEEIKKQSQFTESGLLANAAKEFNENSDPETAALLALEALPDKTSLDKQRNQRHWAPRARVQLDAAVRGLRERLVLKGHPGKVRSAVFSPDGTKILTASTDNTAQRLIRMAPRS